MSAQQTVKLFSVLAIRAAFDRLLPLWQQRCPQVELQVEWAPTTRIEQWIADGRRADAVIVTTEAMDRLVEQAVVEAGSRRELVDSTIGVATLPDAAQPDLSSAAALKQSLLQARSVGYSLGGASGIWFKTVLERLDITQAVNARASTIDEGFTARLLLEGKADLAVQQISELLTVPGIKIAGSLPDELQKVLSFPGALFRNAGRPAEAAALLAFLRSDAAREVFQACGLTPRA